MGVDTLLVINAMDGAFQAHNGNNLAAGLDNANFLIDINSANGNYDKFNFASITGPGSIVLSDCNIMGVLIIDEIIMQVFSSPNIASDATFSATNKVFVTPVFNYRLSSLGEGSYSF